MLMQNGMMDELALSVWVVIFTQPRFRKTVIDKKGRIELTIKSNK
jgi:hypothetical protein